MTTFDRSDEGLVSAAVLCISVKLPPSDVLAEDLALSCLAWMLSAASRSSKPCEQVEEGNQGVLETVLEKNGKQSNHVCMFSVEWWNLLDL